MTKDEAGLEKLKAIGVDKIADDTYIGDTSIEYFLNKEFDKLAPVKAYGFIQILEKQYDIDLSYYRFEYDKATRSENAETDEFTIDPSLMIEKDKNSLPIILGIVVLLGAIAIGYWFFQKPDILDVNFDELI